MNGFVYAIAAGDAVKIGWSRDPIARLANIQTGSSEQCKLLGFMPGTLADEGQIHERFANHRRHGEWFDRHEKVEQFIATLPPAPAREKTGRNSRPGNALRDWRERNGHTVVECAMRLGIDHSSVSRIELGKFFPSFEVLVAIVRMTDGEVTPNDIFSGMKP